MSDTSGSRQSRNSSSVLWERVEQQGRDIKGLADDTATQFRDFRSEVNQAIGGVVASVDKLGTKFEASAAAMAERQRPQYLGLFGAMVSAIGLAVLITQTLSGLHDKPIDEKLNNLATNIADLTRNTTQAFGEAAKATVSHTEFQQAVDYRDKLTAIQQQARDNLRGQMQKEIEQLDAEQKHTADNVVSRKELEYHWAGADKADQDIRTAITALSTRLDNLAPAGDTIRTLRENQHELELKVYQEHK